MNIARILATKGEKVVTIGPTQTVREAVQLLDTHNIGALVVRDEAGRLVGMLSERDVVREAARNEQVLGCCVSDIMTREVITGQAADDLKVVANTMTERRIRHLPVLERGTILGIVSIGDIVKAQRDEYEGEVDTLQAQLSAPRV